MRETPGQLQPVSSHIVGLLKACARHKDLSKGSELHAYIREHEFLEKDQFVACSLVSMYARCGALAKAQQVLGELSVRSVIAWNALISGYAQQGQGKEALKCYHSMQREGYFPDAVTFVCALKACGTIRAATMGEKIHDKIVSLGLLEKNVVLGNTLVDMYAKCGALTKAQQVLDELPARDVITWTTVIAGYAQQGQGEEALKCFDRMQSEGFTPNAVTFTSALKACGLVGEVFKGEKIHDRIVHLGLLEKDRTLGSTLVDMYARCGSLSKAQKVLNELPLRDAVTWTALITGYAQKGQAKEALKCFESMQREGYSPDMVSFICALKACGSIGAIAKGERIHSEIVGLGMLKKSIVLGNTLVDMYAKCGALAKAQEVLDELSLRNVVTWTAIIAGYTQHGQGEEALKCFDSMQYEGHSPNNVTFVCALKACGSIGAVGKGKQIHDKIVSLGLLEKDVILGSTLVDMYAKCAALSKAAEVLDKFPVQNVVTWNALIGGYGQQGQSGEAFKYLEKMPDEGVWPDSTTFVCVLNSCSHSGLLDWAKFYFFEMSRKYGITPNLEHYACMVDLFGRSGGFTNSLNVIEKMPFGDYIPVWLTLLGASRQWEQIKIGRLAFEYALQLGKNDAATYISMVKIYTAAGLQEDAENIEVIRMVSAAWEELGICDFD